MNEPTTSPTILGQRLQQARKIAGYTQQQAADQCGVARTTIVAIEKGERTIRDEELMALAKFYRQPLSELLRKQATLNSVSLQFRGEVAPEVRAMVEGVSLQLTQDYLHLERTCGASMQHRLPPEVIIGQDPKMSARLAAEEERSRLRLGNAPVVGMRSLLEDRLGVRTFLIPADRIAGVSGFYFYEETAGPVICLNGGHHWRRRRWSCAHEFGHALASRYKAELVSDNDEPGYRPHSRRTPEEVFADEFARHFLLPKSPIERLVTERKRERGGKFVVSDIKELAREFGVSFEAMCRTLEEDGFVKPNTVEVLRHQGYKFADDIDDRVFLDDQDNAVVSPRFQRLAVSAYLQEKISEGTFARLIRRELLDAREIIRRYSDLEAHDASVDGADRGERR